MTPTVFIHTNHKQLVGALVSSYSLKRNSRHPEGFEVRVINSEDHPFLKAREGQPFLREGKKWIWRYDDLQSFTPLRFMPPELMGYRGRAVVIDPDIFAVGDITELLDRDMKGKAILCKARRTEKKFASSVMLLDCAKLTHWKCEEQFNELFEMKRDYMDWISLLCEPEETIGLFEEEWNSFDTLNEKTKLLHNTKRRTQPWKTGLPVDFTLGEKARRKEKLGVIGRFVHGLMARPAPAAYEPHPDPNQERFFFSLLRECVDKGMISESLLHEEMRRNHIRHDALELLERARPLAA
ncbi:MAG TPA: hypothetical protein VED46_10350 [Alphaproteobacteria bacterium]|nr:hypothetical protein [Alphaproteobacteria bacterium]